MKRKLRVAKGEGRFHREGKLGGETRLDTWIQGSLGLVSQCSVS